MSELDINEKKTVKNVSGTHKFLNTRPFCCNKIARRRILKYLKSIFIRITLSYI